MPKVIAFTSPKGGCGASFVCSGVWRSLSDMSYKVLAMDMCFEKCSLDFTLGFCNDYIYTMTDVTEGSCTLEEALCQSSGGSFIRSDYESQTFDVSRAFEVIEKSSFDYVLIDLTSGEEEIIRQVSEYTDMLICVTEPTLLSVKMCGLRTDKYNFKNSLVLVNKIIPSYIQAGIHLTIDEILDMVSCPLLGLVPWSPKVEIMLRQGLKFGIEDAALETVFGNIARRITGEYVSAYDFKNVYDCFKLGRNFGVKGD